MLYVFTNFYKYKKLFVEILLKNKKMFMNHMNIAWKKIIGCDISIFKYFIIKRKKYMFYILQQQILYNYSKFLYNR